MPRRPVSRLRACAAAAALLAAGIARAADVPAPPGGEAVPAAPAGPGRGTATPDLPSSGTVPADPDLPQLVANLLHLHAPETLASPGRLHLTPLPYVLSSPLLGVGVGLAAVGQFRLAPSARYSRLEASAFVTTHAQYGILVRTEISLPRQDWILAGDWGGGVFPNPAWGLGGETGKSDRTVVERSQLQLHETVYRRVTGRLYGGLGYMVDDFYDVRDRRAARGEHTRFSAYPVGTAGRSLSSGVTLNALWDGRDSAVRPGRGSYLLARLRFEPALLGSDDDWRSLYLDARTYLAPPGRDDVVALWAFAWSAWGRTPYLLLPQIGADPEHRSGRGLVEGRFAAQDLLYGEAEYRAHLWRSLGAVAAVSLTAPSQRGVGDGGPLFRTLHPGLAAGLRVLLDRASGANLVLDLGWAPAGELGFYLNANETF